MWAPLLSLVAATVSPAPTEPGVPAAAVAAAHVQDCIDAVTARGVDLALLRKRGWRSGNVTVGKGKKAPFELFGKPNDMTFLSAFQDGPQAGSCILLLPTPTVAEAEALRVALGRKAAWEPGRKPREAEVWTTSRHRFSIAEIGNAHARGLRVIVKPLEGR